MKRDNLSITMLVSQKY